MTGWIKLHRKMLESPIWTQLSPAVAKVAVTMLLKANHGPARWYDGQQQVDIPMGSFVTSYPTMARGCHLTVKQIRGAVEHLGKLDFAAYTRAPKYTLVTVKNYATYQARDDEQGSHQGDIGARSGHDEGTKQESKKERMLHYAPEAWPQTVAAVTSYFPVHATFVARIIGKARDAKPDATDEQIAQAVYASYHPSQRTAGLFLSRVPECLRNGYAGRKPTSLTEQLIREVNAL